MLHKFCFEVLLVYWQFGKLHLCQNNKNCILFSYCFGFSTILSITIRNKILKYLKTNHSFPLNEQFCFVHIMFKYCIDYSDTKYTFYYYCCDWFGFGNVYNYSHSACKQMRLTKNKWEFLFHKTITITEILIL